MSIETIILPETFRSAKYLRGSWLDDRLHWSEESEILLASAVDLKISFNDAANCIGRSPAAIFWKAYKLFSYWRLPHEWKKKFGKYNPHPRQIKENLQYPFIVKPDDRHSDLIAVNQMVSRAMPGREDVCQDIMLALWESKTSLEELRNEPKALRAFIKSFRSAYFEKNGYGVESMDVTIHHDGGNKFEHDGGNKFEHEKYQKTLANHDEQFIEDLVFGERGKGYTANFSEALIQQISNEEEEIGVPAAFWMRAEKFLYEDK